MLDQQIIANNSLLKYKQFRSQTVGNLKLKSQCSQILKTMKKQKHLHDMPNRDHSSSKLSSSNKTSSLTDEVLKSILHAMTIEIRLSLETIEKLTNLGYQRIHTNGSEEIKNYNS